jgi:hypothetical protein
MPKAQQVRWASAYDKATVGATTEVPFDHGDLNLPGGRSGADLATAQHLQASQWGVMNETGNYPGQALALAVPARYQIPPGSTGFAANADVWAVLATGVCTVLLLLIPFIPGLRDITRLIPVHRLIWRSWYQSQSSARQNNGAASPKRAARLRG